MTMKNFFDETSKKGVRILNPKGGLEKVALVGGALGAASASADVIINGVSYNSSGQATMTSGDGSHSVSVDNTVDDNGYVRIDVIGENINTGTTYDSASFNLSETVSPLSLKMVDAGMASNETEAYGLRIGSGLSSSDSTISLTTGWNGTDNGGKFDLSHEEGWAGFDYSPFLQGDSAVVKTSYDAQDFVDAGMGQIVGNKLVNNNGDFFLQVKEIGDYDAFVGTSESGLTEWSTQGQSYGVIPEPAALGLILIGSALMLGAKRLLTKK